MTTTGAAAEKVVVKPAEKMEKRRALGRGLESLLPGPRVVSTEHRVPSSEVADAVRRPAAASAAAAEPPVGESGVAGKSQVPFETVEIHAVAEGEIEASAGALAPHESQSDVPAEGITLQAVAAEAGPRAISVKAIPLDCVEENPYQTRYIFDKESLQELADSIKVNGVLQPIVVRPAEEVGRYILVLGERRLQASKLAGNETIPAIIRRVSQQQAAEMTLIENLQREDLNCMEQAEAFRVLSKEFEMTQEEIGKRVGMSRESVSNYMRLLRLPEKVMDYLLHDRLTFSEARELLGLQDASKMQEAADIVVSKHMSILEIETLVAKYNGWPDAQDPVSKPGTGGGARWQDPNVRAAQIELQQVLRLRVKIQDRKGRGKIVIEYHTVDDYERVVGMLKGSGQ